MNETRIREFWNRNPCGELLVGGIEKHRGDVEAFFTEYDRFRYSTESHIPGCLDRIGFAGRSVLEIGLGQGADSEQIIRRGALWSGLDLTSESVDRVRARLELRQLPYRDLVHGSILQAPFADGSFDIVYSHGVLHHIPDILAAQHEIHRLLKPGGELVVMLYARYSLNYLLSIAIVRRLGLLGLHLTGYNPGGIIGEHMANARDMGITRYLRMENFLHRSTDGPHNPFSRVYDLAEVRRHFPDFRIVGSHKEFMHAPPLPVRGLPLARWLGWHLWVHLRAT